MQGDQTKTPAAVAYFDEVRESFLAARDKVEPVIDQFYDIAGYTLRLSFAGQSLIPKLTRAFSHLSTGPTGSPALTIFIWDSASTATALPQPPWDVQEFVARREMWGVKGSRIHASFEFAEHAQLSILNREEQSAVYWVPDALKLSHYASSAPLFTILHWWLRDHGYQLTHAGAVGTPSGGVVVAGKGGSGKSTTTLACLASDLRYASDDYVLLRTAGSPFVHTLYNTARLDHEHLRRTLPCLLPAVSRSGEIGMEKATLFLDEHYPEKLISGFPLKAVVLPRVSGGPTCRLTEVSPARGVTAMAPSTLFQLRWAGSEDFQNIARAVREVPNYILELGDDLGTIPDLIFRLLAE